MTYDGRLPGGSPLFPYVGNKYSGREKIASFFPDDLTHLVSPFFGRGDIEHWLAATRGVKITGYDHSDPMMALWRTLQEDPRGFADRIEAEEPPSQERFRDWWWNQRFGLDTARTDRDKAVIFYGYIWGCFVGRPENAGTARETHPDVVRALGRAEILRSLEIAPGMEFLTRDFHFSIPRHRDDFLYLDPPFYAMEQYHSDTQKFPHDTLLRFLKKHRGGFALSYNHHPWIWDNYGEFQIEKIDRHRSPIAGHEVIHDEVLVISPAR